jgi:glyceraldehyde 3-phosphate dehydrogenase
MSDKKVRIAINGFGRIGKMAFKVAFEHHRDKMEVVAINDPGAIEDSVQGLKYDSVYRRFPFEVTHEDDNIIVDGVKMKKFGEREPEQLPWKDLDIDVVLECTGVFRTRERAQKHIDAGAKKVMISAPAKGDDPVGTLVKGVNDDACSPDETIFSNASCTTNSIAPVMAVLEETFGVEKALMSTIHGYTADQNLVDGTHKDPRRARSAGINIIPTSTGAALATTKTVPSLEGKFDGMAFRVPVPVGSASDVTALLGQDVTVEEVNGALTKASESDRFTGVLMVTNDPIVSTDIIGNPFSSIVDLQLTKVQSGNLVKVVAWYDNEYGYSHRLVEQAVAVANV